MDIEVEEVVKLILSIFVIIFFLPLIAVILLPFLSFVCKSIFIDELIDFIILCFLTSLISFSGLFFYLKIIKTNFFEFSSRRRKLILSILFFIANMVLCLFSFGIMEMYIDFFDSISKDKISSFKMLVSIIKKIVTPCYVGFFFVNAFLPIPLLISDVVRGGYPLKWYNWIIAIPASILIIIIVFILLSPK